MNRSLSNSRIAPNEWFHSSSLILWNDLNFRSSISKAPVLLLASSSSGPSVKASGPLRSQFMAACSCSRASSWPPVVVLDRVIWVACILRQCQHDSSSSSPFKCRCQEDLRLRRGNTQIVGQKFHTAVPLFRGFLFGDAFSHGRQQIFIGLDRGENARTVLASGSCESDRGCQWDPGRGQRQSGAEGEKERNYSHRAGRL